MQKNMSAQGAPLSANNFDFLRLLLASLVILSHSWPLVLGDDLAEPIGRWTNGRFTLGQFAVYSFFAISGFLITASWQRSTNLRAYLLKRVARIYPGFLAAIALSYLIVAPLAGVPAERQFSPRHIVGVIFQSATLQVFTDPRAFATQPYPHLINASIWTIQYEFACYLMLPILAFIGAFSRCGILVAVLAIDIAANAIIIHFHLLPYLPLPLVIRRYLPTPDAFAQFSVYFLAGSLFYLFRQAIRFTGIGALIVAAALVATLKFPTCYAVISPIALTYLLLWFAFSPRIRLHGFGKRGDFSYGTYLYAFPIQQLLVLWIGASRLVPFTLFLIAWPLSLLAGAASWFLVERPFMALRAKKVQPLQEPTMQQAVAGT